MLTADGNGIDYEKVRGRKLSDLPVGWDKLDAQDPEQEFTIDNARKLVLRKLASQARGEDPNGPKIDIGLVAREQKTLFDKMFGDQISAERLAQMSADELERLARESTPPAREGTPLARGRGDGSDGPGSGPVLGPDGRPARR